ncbi:hypothetical protein IT409_01210 [Candidatus Falkowbacteria bacterium]|nr:hypothetical protein [Candidatus Falkowbacteria bacterium]
MNTEFDIQENKDNSKITLLNADAVEFVNQRDRLKLELQAFLTPYSPKEYIEHKIDIFLTEDKKSGFGVTLKHELVSLFSLEAKRGPKLVQLAIEKGVTHLTCIGDKLLVLYKNAGFEIAKAEAWNPDYAPKYWNYEKFGSPKVFTMVLPGKYNPEIEHPTILP